jgi:glycosyltransferase involved in cell wall biosynthesis/predicted O-methyltransferase YrrM
MHILIISDAYPPMRTSCATQIYDLAQAFVEQSHQVSIVIPAHSQKNAVEISNTDGLTVYSVRCFKTKDVGYARRTIAEFINPFIIGFHLRKNSNFLGQKIDGIAWYSPTIFWGPLVKQLKRQFACKAYLILRDIFPDWAWDLGLIKSKLLYAFFRRITSNQFSQADQIGAQSPNNIPYLAKHYPQYISKFEVLWNWVGLIRSKPCSIDLSQSSLSGKLILIYAGNLGVAQDVGRFLDLAKYVQDRPDIGFIFVGRGSEKAELERQTKDLNLKHMLFFDEIDSQELPSLYEQCSAGLIGLDPRHNTHNIPGKFSSYIQSGLPVLGFVNPGNDLLELTEQWGVGRLVTSTSQKDLSLLIKFIDEENIYMKRYVEMLKAVFSPAQAANQIADTFNVSNLNFDNQFNVANNFSKLSDIGRRREAYKENSLLVLERGEEIRHYEPSLICSADDTSGPNKHLIDISLRAVEMGWNEEISAIDQTKSDSIFFNVFPGEHYRLLRAIVKIMNPINALEIGTYTGMGTLAISQGLGTGCLHTFDIFPWDSMSSHLDGGIVDGHRVIQHVADLSLDGEFDRNRHLFDQADFIFLDAPKDGVFEYKMLDLFQTLKPKAGRLLMLDDIRFVNMVDLWRSIASPKLDITSFGHWSGTGLVDISKGLKLTKMEQKVSN